MNEALRTGKDANDSAKLYHEISKLNETVSYMFRKAKNLGTKISGFHETHCVTSEELNLTREYVVNYDSSLQKLDDIFERYVDMKRAFEDNGKNAETRKFDFSSSGEIPKKLKSKALKPVEGYIGEEDGIKVRVKSRSKSRDRSFGFADEDEENQKKIEKISREFENKKKKLNQFFKKNVKII